MENKKIKQIEGLIGNTPLIEITYKFKSNVQKAYFKLEWCNLTGSIKDRMVLHTLKKAYEENLLQLGKPIIETSSGNTGISLSAIGSYIGNPVTICMPEHMSEERKFLIKSFGANLELITKEEGFLGCLEKAKVLQKETNAFLPLQFENENNVEAHYLITGLEIIKQLEKQNKKATHFIAGVGTGGTLMGIGKRLKEYNAAEVLAVEPASSPVLKVGKKIGSHKIQGISDEFIPPIYKKEWVDDIIDINDYDAILMVQKLSKELGLGVGISSGANFLGTVFARKKENDVIVSVFPDDNKKYLSIFKEDALDGSKNSIVSEITLLGYCIL